MRKRLSEKEFLAAVQKTRIGERSKAIARGVLVDGLKQTHFVELFKMRPPTVSQAVERVWRQAQLRKSESRPMGEHEPLIEGYERVTAVLPAAQAYQVKIWAQRAQRRLKETQ